MHDGSVLVLKKLEKDYDPTDKWQALKILEDEEKNSWFLTGLIYINPHKPTLFDYANLVDQPLNRINSEDLRPSPETLDMINQSMY